VIDARQAKAEIAMLKVQMRAIEKGMVVSKPTAEGTRYDLILDDHGQLFRVQVKYSSVLATHSSGSIQIRLVKNDGKGCARPYADTEIDLLAVYLPSIDKICAIPISVCRGMTGITLRISDSKNGQKKKIWRVNDFIF
jgi:hypothetical protein